MRAIVKVKDVSKVYKKDSGVPIYALRNVSVAIGDGEFVAIMGPSGSGKSTLMNVLGCLDRPSEGEVLIDGQKVNLLDDEALARVRNQKIGFVFQSFNLLPRTSAIENVELPLIYSERDKISGLAKAALENVGLGDRLNHQPGELSGGQQQRVAIARALVNDPEIILADEPTGNLDSRASYEILALFQQLNRQGRTVVIVTHEPDIAEYATRIIKIADGAIESDAANLNVRRAEDVLKKIANTVEVKS
ncbi:MAG TPA: ABC transporter ATP-binding protein [bacterium]|nr:ABC transporter ATP-binding protein [bacterium]